MMSTAASRRIAGRPTGALEATAIAVAVAVLGFRAVESSGGFGSFARVVGGALALGIFFLCRTHSTAKRVMMLLALEVVTGTIAFVLVDYPFVRQHAAQIQQVVIATLQDQERERLAERRLTLALPVTAAR